MATKVMTIPEIDKAFDKLSADANMRALSAIIRIGAEQIESRGKLGFLRNGVFATGALSVILTIVVQFVPMNVRGELRMWQFVLVGICIVCLAFLWRVRTTLEQYLEEEKRIRSMMIESANKITSSPVFMPTPLSHELRGSLKDALKNSVIRPNEELIALSDRN